MDELSIPSSSFLLPTLMSHNTIPYVTPITPITSNTHTQTPCTTPTPQQNHLSFCTLPQDDSYVILSSFEESLKSAL